MFSLSINLTFFYPTDRVDKRGFGKVLTTPPQTCFTAIPYKWSRTLALRTRKGQESSDAY